MDANHRADTHRNFRAGKSRRSIQQNSTTYALQGQLLAAAVKGQATLRWRFRYLSPRGCVCFSERICFSG